MVDSIITKLGWLPLQPKTARVHKNASGWPTSSSRGSRAGRPVKPLSCVRCIIFIELSRVLLLLEVMHNLVRYLLIWCELSSFGLDLNKIPQTVHQNGI